MHKLEMVNKCRFRNNGSIHLAGETLLQSMNKLLRSRVRYTSILRNLFRK